ncbi:DUF6653 family protein [Sulfurospirillum arcachonense]|uniref:DUF6653 family protein n=1 Tax=Sulfurospirillum arcachonense TaxID=57666 RepID=UPI0004685E38|nr:DUF6653 family protein [Sulfurospirillum arcachonense]
MAQTSKNIFTNLMSMDEATWERHASPLSVWTRVITGLPVILLSAWSIKSIGWWSLILIAISFFWIWLNPRLFSPPKNTNNWASKVTFGERVWLNRSEHPIPDHHKKWANFLSIVAGVGFLIAIIGAFFHISLLAISGGLISWFGKMWFCDRMVWLYEDMRITNKQYDSWLKNK